mgnify:CR=1 FL=1|jgi:hypothetical protein
MDSQMEKVAADVEQENDELRQEMIEMKMDLAEKVWFARLQSASCMPLQNGVPPNIIACVFLLVARKWSFPSCATTRLSYSLS